LPFSKNATTHPPNPAPVSFEGILNYFQILTI